MIAVIDYRMGNLSSIAHRIEKLGTEACVTSEKSLIDRADKIIFPGVGSFEEGMKNLKELKLVDILEENILHKKKPVLGICLGMQLFSQRSEEGLGEGLGWFNAQTVRFQFSQEKKLRVPHVGWNAIKPVKASPLLTNIPAENRLYFTHSYKLICQDEADVVALTLYGEEFVSVIQKNNMYGVQFHPETSHQDGIQILKNFIELC